MIRTLFRRTAEPEFGEPTVRGAPARVPPGVCVYAVGDIHGRVDLLTTLQHMIMEDAAQLTPGTERVVVYMGDYVDRGLESRQVVDRLIHHPLPGFTSVHLLGNHDAWLLSFLVDTRIGRAWLRYGGDVTLHSYGIRIGHAEESAEYFAKLQATLRLRLPREHVEFLRDLELLYQSGDYLFAHAGVRPGIPLDQQTADDLLWIREPFLSSREDFGKVVVHGHTVVDVPVVRSNRIGIDTGACWSGRLTSLVLEEHTYRFLNTGSP